MLKNENKKLCDKILVKVSSLIIAMIISFVIITSYFMQNYIKIIKENIKHEIYHVERELNDDFLDTNYIFYNLAILLSHESIYSNKSLIKTIFDLYVNVPGYSFPYYPFKFIDNKGDIISGSGSIFSFHKKNVKLKSFPEYLNKARTKVFELQIGKIIHGSYLKKLLIPLSIGVKNNNNHIGIIWGGINIEGLNKKLTSEYAHSQYFNSVILKNKNKDYLNKKYISHELEDSISLISILRSSIQDNNIIVHRKLENYAFTIEIELNTMYLLTLVITNIIFLCFYFIIFVMFFCLLYFVIKSHYEKPLLLIYKKLGLVNQDLDTTTEELDKFYSTRKLHPNELAKEVNILIDSYHELKNTSVKKVESEIKQRILNLVLVEKHFIKYNKTNDIDERKLYLNKLVNLVDEGYTRANIKDYLKNITDYCSEFYHEIVINVIILEEDDRDFSFKHAALTETIFNIFTFIVRGNFDIYNSPLIIRANFDKESDFPLIIIEADISDKDSSTALGWLHGPSYVNTGLLSIYLLAKENDLFLDIQKQEDKLMFILEPMSKENKLYEYDFDNSEIDKYLLEPSIK